MDDELSKEAKDDFLKAYLFVRNLKMGAGFILIITILLLAGIYGR